MEEVLRWQPLVESVSQCGLTVPLILAIIWVESQGSPEIVNPISQATGLTQVLPAEVTPTAWGRPTQGELLNPHTNVLWGCKILSYFLEVHNGDFQRALYAYSGGSRWGSWERYEEEYWKSFQDTRGEIERLVGQKSSVPAMVATHKR